MTTTSAPTPGAAPAPAQGTRRSLTPLVLAAGGLLLAVLLTVVGSPAWLRIVVCLPLLLGISGAAISGIVLPPRATVDGLIRAALVVLFGVTSLVCAALIVALVCRNGLGTDDLVLVDAGLALVALGVFAVLNPGGVAAVRARPLGPGTAGGSAWVSAVAGLVLVVVALVVGRSLLPVGNGSPTFDFTGPAATDAGPIVSSPGREVPLDWVVRDAGQLPAWQPLQAVIDGHAVDVLSDVTPVARGEYAGRAVVLAPSTIGLHRIVLSLPLPDRRLELVTYVDVRPY